MGLRVRQRVLVLSSGSCFDNYPINRFGGIWVDAISCVLIRRIGQHGFRCRSDGGVSVGRELIDECLASCPCFIIVSSFAQHDYVGIDSVCAVLRLGFCPEVEYGASVANAFLVDGDIDIDDCVRSATFLGWSGSEVYRVGVVAVHADFVFNGSALDPPIEQVGGCCTLQCRYVVLFPDFHA